MRPAAFLVVSVVAFAAAVTAVTFPAVAGPPAGAKSDPKVAARALAEHGHSLFEAGRFAEAIDVFQQAERLYHAPTLVLALARAHAAMNRLVEARAIYERAASEPLADGAPKVWKDAQKAAKEELSALDKRIPAVRILVRGGGGTGLRVSVDQREVQGYRPDLFVSLDPGTRVVTVVPFGGIGKSRTIELREGARITVEFELSGAAPSVVPAPVAPVRAEAPPPWRVPSYVCFGVGAVGLGLGIGAGIVTLNKASSLKAACPTGTCATHAHDADIDAANGMGIASTTGFVLAAVGATAGTVLWFVTPGAKRPVEVGVGPGSLDVRGVF